MTRYTKVMPPQWALEMRDKVCRERVIGYRGLPPQLFWYLRLDGAHGRCWNSPNLALHERKIKMYAPVQPGPGGRYILLHELAHALLPGQHHSKDFWTLCFKLCHAYGNLPEGFAEQRAINYKPGTASRVLGGEWERQVAARKAAKYRLYVRQLMWQVRERVVTGQASGAAFVAKDLYTYGRRLATLEKRFEGRI